MDLVAACVAGNEPAVARCLAARDPAGAATSAAAAAPRARPTVEAFRAASTLGHAGIVELLVAAASAHETADTDDDGAAMLDAALVDASREGHLAVVTCLLRAGANVRARHAQALQGACLRGHTAVVRALLAAAATDLGSSVVVVENGGVALMLAAAHGHGETVAALLEAGADPNGTDAIALRMATLSGHADAVRRLEEAGADRRASASERLRYASAHGQHAVVADALAASGGGALAAASINKALRVASGAGDLATVERLLAVPGVDVHAEQEGPLRAASAGGHAAVVARLLAAGARLRPPKAQEAHWLQALELPLEGMWPAVLQAARGGHTDVVELLLQHKPPSPAAADAVASTRDDVDKALVEACVGGHLATVARLVQLGARVLPEAMVVACGRSAENNVDLLQLLISAGGDVHGSEQDGAPFVVACSNGQQHMAALLAAAGADPRAHNDAALAAASGNGHLETVEWLLSIGAFVNANDDRALVRASMAGHAHVVRRLLEVGAIVNVNRNEPLMLACESGHAAVVACLVAAGADVDSVSPRGDTPLTVACRGAHVEVVQTLVNAGVNLFDQRGSRAVGIASDTGVAALVSCLLAAGAAPSAIHWNSLVRLERIRCLQLLPASRFDSLPADVQPLWVRYKLRLHRRLRGPLQRARDRLDRPPQTPLGVAHPTRAELIAHLRTAGRRFAREYWTDGIPLFFAGQQAALGPLPSEFADISFV